MEETNSGAELRQIIERWEHLEAEKSDIADAQKEVMNEAKGRGYCVRTLRAVISLRKLHDAERNEREAILDTYKSAIGM